MNAMSVQCSYRNHTENFINSHPTVYLRHSQTMDQVVTSVLFIEFPDLQFYIEPVIDSVYITGTCHFRLYFFFLRSFAIPLFHLLFVPAAPFVAIPLHMAQLAPPLAPPAGAPPASPPQVVPSLSLDDDEDPFEALASSPGSSSGPSDSHTPAEPSMANRFLSFASDQRLQRPSRLQCIVWPYFGMFMTLAIGSVSFCISQRDTI